MYVGGAWQPGTHSEVHRTDDERNRGLMETKRKQMIPRKFVYDAVKANHISPSTYAYIHTRQAKAKKKITLSRPIRHRPSRQARLNCPREIFSHRRPATTQSHRIPDYYQPTRTSVLHQHNSNEGRGSTFSGRLRTPEVYSSSTLCGFKITLNPASGRVFVGDVSLVTAARDADAIPNAEEKWVEWL